MRVWDQIEPSRLCREHLLAEHRETLAIWSILTNNKKGYRNHPEVRRWENNLYHLCVRHYLLIQEAKRRGYNFKELPNVDKYLPDTLQSMENYPKPWDNQIQTLKLKECECKV